MRAFPLLFGAVRHMRLIGEDDRHKALRARNETRLAALKATNRLYEVKREPTPAECYSSARNITTAEYTQHLNIGITNTTERQRAAAYNAGNGYQAGSALASILGVSFNDWFDDRR